MLWLQQKEKKGFWRTSGLTRGPRKIRPNYA
eukprot:COSAG01_NODE_72959_length_251_cov_1.263158_1_plen_30_part_01